MKRLVHALCGSLALVGVLFFCFCLGWLVGWLVGLWLAVGSVGLFVGWLVVGWLVGWSLVGLFVGWLVGCRLCALFVWLVVCLIVSLRVLFFFLFVLFAPSFLQESRSV